MWLVGLVLLGGVGSLAVGEGVSVLSVPEGIAPTLDGILSQGEWTDALEPAPSDVTTFFLKYRTGFLYLGVRAVPGAEAVGNIYIAREGIVEILHASYALGSATYRLEERVWILEKPFTWSCRKRPRSALTRGATSLSSQLCKPIAGLTKTRSFDE